MGLDINGNVQTEQIIVFPTTRRIGKAQESKFLSEKAITRITNTIIDTDGFVITDADADTKVVDPLSSFEFDIFGYYFKLSQLIEIMRDPSGTPMFSDATDIYASILIELDTSELVGWDDDLNGETKSMYSGVKFTSSIPTNPYDPSKYELHYIHILHRDTPSSEYTDWGIPPEGKEKFNGDTFRVDGGIIR